MRFRDPETGKVFEDISDAVASHCGGRRCADCELDRVAKSSDFCISWPREHPREAAERMGYEVIEDEPEEN